MKILLVNYRYFISGGPEKYMFNIKKVFEDQGHEVVPFSIKSSKNVKTDYDRYFVKPIGGMDQVYYSDYKKDLKTLSQLFLRSFYSFEVKKALKYEIRNEDPDVVYILHFINKLSPSVIAGAREMGKRVIVRLSDFFLLCPRFDFLYQQEICEECLVKGLFSAIRKKCVQDSLPASVIRVLSMYFHNLFQVYDKIDALICPSNFMARKLINAGFDSKKIFHVPTFIDSSNITPIYKGEYILFLGRFTLEKGIRYLIKAYHQMGNQERPLKIVGDDTTNEAVEWKEYIRKNNINNIEFLGFKSGLELNNIIQNCRFVVVPSICYDNMPNVILEAFAHGKPVIASNLGSLPELVDHNQNGLLFEPKNVDDLILKIRQLDDDNLVTQFGMNARKKVEKLYNVEKHYNKLINILKDGGNRNG